MSKPTIYERPYKFFECEIARVGRNVGAENCGCGSPQCGYVSVLLAGYVMILEASGGDMNAAAYSVNVILNGLADAIRVGKLKIHFSEEGKVNTHEAPQTLQ